MIVKNRLLNFGDNIIYQNDDWFLFSLDSVLLANFVTLKLTDKKILDLCSGNAPVPMLMSFRTKAHIYGVELQNVIYELGKQSIMDNKMDNQIDIYNEDIVNLSNVFNAECIDVVTCNPPYFKYKEDSLINDNIIKTIARHEMKLDLEIVIKNASFVLKNGGTFALVHRPCRLIEIIELMKKYRIEPKKIRFVYPKVNKEANILLIEGVKNGKCGVKLLPPLITHNEDNTYTDEIREMFGGASNVANKL